MLSQISMFCQLPAEVLAQCIPPGHRLILAQTNKKLRAHLAEVCLGLSLRVFYRHEKLIQRLADLSQRFRLESIDISSISLTAQHFKALAKRKDLQFGYLHTIIFGENDPKTYRFHKIAPWLQRCTAMTRTDALRSTNLHLDVWASVQQCTHLDMHDLHLIHCKEIPNISINLAKCTRLTSLDLSNNSYGNSINVPNIVRAALPGKSSLTSLDLGHGVCQAADMPACLTAWRDSREVLQKLSLYNFIFHRDIAIEAFATLGRELGHCTNLQDLNLGSMRMVPECLASFVQGVTATHGLPSLTHLRMGGNHLNGPDSVPLMTQLISVTPQLQHMELGNNSLHPDMLGGGWLTGIQHLNLTHGCLGGHGMECLFSQRGHLHALKHLDVSYNSLGNADLVRLAGVLEACRSLESANLAGSTRNVSTPHEGMCAVMRVLGSLTKVTTLQLPGMHVGIALSEAGCFGGSLQRLDLSYMALDNTSAGVQQVARIMDGCPALHTLALRHNVFDADGLAAMLGRLSRPCALRVLKLSGNKLLEDGVLVLVQAQALLRHLVEIEMRGCEVGNAGAKRFAEAADGWPSLRLVDMAMNRIGEDAMTALGAARQRRGWRLRLGMNFLSYKVEQRLVKEGCEN